jgi:cytoskeletal protein CcmA (bactofilin family)
LTLGNGKVSPFIRIDRSDGDTRTSRGATPTDEARAPTSALPEERAERVTTTESGPDNAPDAHTSVISRDLTILGRNVRIVSKGKIRVDGEIQGNVLGAEVVIGDLGRVSGEVSEEKVTVFGTIMGTIRGSRVLLKAGSKVEGDVHHETLSVHEGACVDGRLYRNRILPSQAGPSPKSHSRVP